MSKFEVFKGAAGDYHWRLKASNGEIIALGDAYTTKEHAKAGCDAVRRAAKDADVVET